MLYKSHLCACDGTFRAMQSQRRSQLSQSSLSSASRSSIKASCSPRCITLHAASAEENFTTKLPSVPLLRSWVCKLGGSSDGCVRPLLLLLLLAVHRCVASKSTFLWRSSCRQNLQKGAIGRQFAVRLLNPVAVAVVGPLSCWLSRSKQVRCGLGTRLLPEHSCNLGSPICFMHSKTGTPAGRH
jgi:hypothetical protein